MCLKRGRLPQTESNKITKKPQKFNSETDLLQIFGTDLFINVFFKPEKKDKPRLAERQREKEPRPAAPAERPRVQCGLMWQKIPSCLPENIQFKRFTKKCIKNTAEY